MKKSLLLLVTLTIFSSSYAQETLYKTTVHNGIYRQYAVYVPASYDSTSATPLLLTFHGYSTANISNYIKNRLDFRPHADSTGSIIVYPRGLRLDSNKSNTHHWNVGSWTTGSTSDDIGFVDSLIDILSTEYSIDQKRIYATGTSNGGYFSFELACHLSHRIAAVASSAGLMSDRTYNSCDPKHPTPILQIHGTADNVVGYDGNTPVNSLSVDEVLDYWIKFNGTDRTPAITSLPDTDPSNGNTSESHEYNQGKNCTSVHHYKVTGGGHILAGLNGNVDIDIMGIIWNFLTQYDINGLIDCPTVSTKEPETKSPAVRIYPNPTKDNIKIVSPSINNQAYSLYDSLGRIIYTGTTIHGNASLDLRELSPDIYILTIQNQTIKIIKR